MYTDRLPNTRFEIIKDLEPFPFFQIAPLCLSHLLQNRWPLSPTLLSSGFPLASVIISTMVSISIVCIQAPLVDLPFM